MGKKKLQKRGPRFVDHPLSYHIEILAFNYYSSIANLPENTTYKSLSELIEMIPSEQRTEATENFKYLIGLHLISLTARAKRNQLRSFLKPKYNDPSKDLSAAVRERKEHFIKYLRKNMQLLPFEEKYKIDDIEKLRVGDSKPSLEEVIMNNLMKAENKREAIKDIGKKFIDGARDYARSVKDYRENVYLEYNKLYEAYLR